MNKKLGIIAGRGLLPVEIANLCLQNGRDFCVAALEGEAEISLLSRYQYQQFPIGSVGGVIDYFTENNVKEILIIGAVTRPDLKSIKVDLTGSILIAKILKNQLLGDDSVLQLVSNFIESKGFTVISPSEFLQITNYDQTYLTKRNPSNQDKKDIELGVKVLRTIGALDIGQSVIICEDYVIGIEAAEGTDNLIRRCENFRKTESGGVLVKMAKTTQDMRLDVPTMGPDTVFYLAKHGYNGLAIQKSGVIIIKPQETIDLLNKHKLFLSYL